MNQRARTGAPLLRLRLEKRKEVLLSKAERRAPEEEEAPARPCPCSRRAGGGGGGLVRGPSLCLLCPESPVSTEPSGADPQCPPRCLHLLSPRRRHDFTVLKETQIKHQLHNPSLLLQAREARMSGNLCAAPSTLPWTSRKRGSQREGGTFSHLRKTKVISSSPALGTSAYRDLRALPSECCTTHFLCSNLHNRTFK
ncbi:hypothetical protein HJG60_008344 [Phyllostomus discolor]|uniref:Uncharacterized protein n=1 Tax=Phyllostomus discolor TaxID=89673 RepID=A0A834DPF3_9CHIR|nr:hypothetical protein HJG60_008344 [Phyllostomus discolor]